MEQKFENIFDTHSHYDDDKFDSDRFSLLKSLKGKGVCNVVSCGCDINSTKFNQLLAQKFDFVYFAAGLHPENLEGCTESDIDEIAKIAADEKCVAIGEIGLDYYWMSSTKEKQREFFTKQIELAKSLDMPIIVHDRDAHGDTEHICANATEGRCALLQRLKRNGARNNQNRYVYRAQRSCNL